MREVVVHRDTRCLATDLHAPAHAREVSQRGDCRLGFDPRMARRSDYRERIQAVVLAQLLPSDPSKGLSLPRHLKGSLAVRRAGFPSTRRREPLYGGPSSLCEHPLQCSVGTVDDKSPRARYGAHQVMKLAFNRSKIIEDVGM